MSAMLVVLRKEVRESLRDRRVLLNALLLGPLLMPVLFVVLIRMMVGSEIEKAEKPLPVVVIGAENAPNLVEALRQQGMKPVYTVVDDVEAAVRNQRIDLALRIDADFARDFRSGRPAQVEIFYDSSRREVESEHMRLESMVHQVSRQTGILRLLARGIAPTITPAVLVAGRDQATSRARGAQIFLMLPYFLALTALLGGMWLAIDSTSGERERQSIEPLLACPAGRGDVVAGKLLATSLFSLASLLLGLLAFLGAGYLLPKVAPEAAMAISPGFLLTALPVMLPLVVLVSSLQILVASFARSFREAQTYLGIIQLLPIIPSVLIMANPVKEQWWMYTVPIFGQQISLLRLMRGEPVPLDAMAASAIATLAVSWILFRLTVRAFRSERFAATSG